MSTSKSNFWSSPLTKSRITSDDVKMPEMLLGYFIGPFGALLSSGIFTCILQNYFTDVLKLDLGFLTTLQLVSTVLIVASNLIVGQLIEHTRALAGKARPWILLSALTLSVASVLMFIVPFEGMAKMVWIAIAYNLYYAVAYPIYNTANSTMIPVSTRDSKQRGALASFTNVAGLGVMGCGSMVFPMLVSFALKEDQHLWFLTMLAIAIFSALTIYLQFLFTRERVTEEGRADTETPAKSATLGEQLKAVTGDRMWWIVMAFYMLFQWSGAMKNGSMSYFCKWVLDNTFFGTADAWGASQGLLSIMGAIPMAVAAVFVVPLANKFGKRLVCGGFMLLGAYTYAILTIPAASQKSIYQRYANGGIGFSIPELLSKPLGGFGLLLGVVFCLTLAGFIAALFAFLIGLPVLKLKSDYLAIATLGFAEIIRAAVVYEGFGPLTNGSNLLYGFTSFASFNLSLGGTTLHLETVMPFLFSGICIAIILLLINSTYGRAFKAIRDDEIAAEAMGINLASHKRMSFIISSFFAGISGAMLAMYQASVQATTFKSSMTYEILLIVVIGGIGSVSGSIIASFLFIASSEWLLRFLDNETWIGGFRVPLLRSGFRMVVFSIIIMAVVLFFRKGIMGDRELFQKSPHPLQKLPKRRRVPNE